MPPTPNPGRTPGQKAKNLGWQTAAVGLLTWYLYREGLPPEVLGYVGALATAALTTVGSIFRNIESEKGWTKYLG